MHIDKKTENDFAMAGYHLKMGMMELCRAMRIAKLDADTVDDVIRKYSILWEAYRDVYERSKEGDE